jgi:hypothetical protein
LRDRTTILICRLRGDVGEGIGPGKDGQQGQKQHLVERIHHLSACRPSVRSLK